MSPEGEPAGPQDSGLTLHLTVALGHVPGLSAAELQAFLSRHLGADQFRLEGESRRVRLATATDLGQAAAHVLAAVETLDPAQRGLQALWERLQDQSSTFRAQAHEADPEGAWQGWRAGDGDRFGRFKV
ncbi:hypothetical protein [Deinococcus multiflagellatus]|uniref:Uncharacterized protein n=1 Tax=Deinococcus multiflagellatus TaxID=1656887 RepID=A0ABW1ZQN9_9DEIO|nr:hypothetical protein [Deinococcus multiflagellatus]MBZ9715794.1 hypothetical protein [Deinococcus multiflagellatus]